jgi:hypothetical protein
MMTMTQSTTLYADFLGVLLAFIAILLLVRGTCPAGTNNQGFNFGSVLKDFPPDATTVDLLFRPDVDVATRSMNTFEIWDARSPSKM